MEWLVVVLIALGAVALVKSIDRAGDKVDHKTGRQVGTILAILLGGAVTLIVLTSARQEAQRQENQVQFQQTCTWTGTC